MTEEQKKENEIPAEKVKEQSQSQGGEVKQDAVHEEKGPAKQAKTTSSATPTECAACSKALLKKMWYYRNSQFFCNKKCFKRKEEEDQKKTEKS